jgi:NADPH-dependent ferric siderophore reductase
MTQQQQAPEGTRPPRKRGVPRSISVVAVKQLSPRMRRVTFGGSDLASFTWTGPAAHIKMIFPEAGSGADTVPVPGPEDPRSPNTRTYTPRRFDPTTQTLEVDFALHGPGPAATWAEQARVGQQVVQMGPAQGYAVDTEAPWYVILGDDAALPAIETILEALPAGTKTTVLLEVVAADEARPLAGPTQTDVRWLVRGPGATPGSALLKGLEGFAWPAGAGRVYVGCEATALRQLRTTILAGSGLDKERVIARGYWRVGAVNHPDHDYAKD